MKKLIIYGQNDFTQNVYYYFLNYSDYEITAFTIDKEYITEDYICGLPLIPFDEVQTLYPPDEYDMFVGLGFANMNKNREKKIKEAKEKGYTLAKFIHPSCYTDKNAIIEENCFLFENVTLSKCVHLKEGNVIQASTTIAHDTTIDKCCYISPNVTVCGYVNVKGNCFIGAGAIIRDNIIIEKECIIGAGVTVLDSTKEKQVLKTQSSILLDVESDKVKHI